MSNDHRSTIRAAKFVRMKAGGDAANNLEIRAKLYICRP